MEIDVYVDKKYMICAKQCCSVGFRIYWWVIPLIIGITFLSNMVSTTLSKLLT